MGNAVGEFWRVAKGFELKNERLQKKGKLWKRTGENLQDERDFTEANS